MEVGPLLRLVLGFVQVADGAEAVGVAVAGFRQQDVGGAARSSKAAPLDVECLRIDPATCRVVGCRARRSHST